MPNIKCDTLCCKYNSAKIKDIIEDTYFDNSKWYHAEYDLNDEDGICLCDKDIILTNDIYCDQCGAELFGQNCNNFKEKQELFEKDNYYKNINKNKENK